MSPIDNMLSFPILVKLVDTRALQGIFFEGPVYVGNDLQFEYVADMDRCPTTTVHLAKSQLS